MPEYVITSKTITTIVGVAVILAVLAGFISYNAGYSNGLKMKNSGNINTTSESSSDKETTDNPKVEDIINSEDVVQEEIVISGEPVNLDGASIINGRVDKISATSFTFNVTIETLNPATRTFNQKTTTYTVLVNSGTNMVENISEITIPPEGGAPVIKTSTRKITLKDLTPEQEVTVFTESDASGTTILAKEIRVNKNIRQ